MTDSAHAQTASKFGHERQAKPNKHSGPARKKLWLWRFGIIILPILVILSGVAATAKTLRCA